MVNPLIFQVCLGYFLSTACTPFVTISIQYAPSCAHRKTRCEYSKRPSSCTHHNSANFDWPGLYSHEFPDDKIMTTEFACCFAFNRYQICYFRPHFVFFALCIFTRWTYLDSWDEFPRQLMLPFTHKNHVFMAVASGGGAGSGAVAHHLFGNYKYFQLLLLTHG